MYYIYEEINGYTVITEQSDVPLMGDNIVTCDEVFELMLYDVFVEHIVDGALVKYRKKLKPVEAVENYLHEIKKEQAEAETEIDYRLSIIELGLI